MLKQISGATGLWNLVHEFCVPSRDLDVRLNHTRDIEDCKDDELDNNVDSEQRAARWWTEMRHLIDILHLSPDLVAIKRLALLAYDVRRSSAFRNIIRTQCQKQHRYLQIVERIGKFAKFFRSAVSVIRVAASAAVRNMRIKLETVPSVSRKIDVLRGHTVENVRTRLLRSTEISSSQSVEIQRLLRRWPKYVVHAEMLLLTFYEEHPQFVLATNYIGISKRSCYLCAQFIRFHNVFAVEGQHQQLYCLWTLPEEIRFGSQNRGARFVKALTNLQVLLAERVKEVSRPLHRPLPYLKESVANFSRATILARAYSLANLGMVREDGSIPNLSLEPVLNLGTAAQDSVKKQSTTDVSSLPLATVEGSLDPAGFTRTPPQLTVSPGLENPSAKIPSEEVGKHSRRHRHRKARHTERHGRRRKSRKSPATMQPYRQAERKRAHVRTQKMRNPVRPRRLGPTRQRPQRACLEEQRYETGGCLSILIIACFKSARSILLKVFHRKG
jgi:hypothetical protein